MKLDSLEDSYQKMKHSAKNLQLLQVGFAIFN